MSRKPFVADYRESREANLLNTAACTGDRLIQLKGFGDFRLAPSDRAHMLVSLRSNAETLTYAANELEKIWKAEGGDDAALPSESRGVRRDDGRG